MGVWVTDAADAVKDYLNSLGSSFSESFTATRGYLPEVTPPTCTDLVVMVVPGPVNVRVGDRKHDVFSLFCNVVIVQRVDNTGGLNESRVDALIAFEHELYEALIRQKLTLQASPAIYGHVQDITVTRPFDANRLEEAVFVGVLTARVDCYQ